jgi:phosphoglycolate phosphatase-like HAD superfamily hydrolase
MKILSDFDGVLTDLAEEAERVREIFLSLLPEATRPLVEKAERGMAADPSRHGWRVHGRITAYWNEDGFVHTNALAAALDELVPSTRSHCELAETAYLKMVEETAAGKLKPVDPAVRSVFRKLCERGVEIVVVSNSGTDRICRLLAAEGLEPSPHAEGSGAPLRVRGHAGKFRLGSAPEIIRVGDYEIDVDRPAYREILLEERPDVVVGDVFSLDLALPLELARRGILEKVRLALRRRPYTPFWVTDFLVKADGRAQVLDRFEDLLSLVS